MTALIAHYRGQEITLLTQEIAREFDLAEHGSGPASPWAQATVTKVREITINGVIIGDDHQARSNALQDALDVEIAGLLILPDGSRYKCECKHYRIRQQSTKQRVTWIEVAFAESGEPSYPLVSAVTQSGVAAALEIAKRVIKEGYLSQRPTNPVPWVLSEETQYFEALGKLLNSPSPPPEVPELRVTWLVDEIMDKPAVDLSAWQVALGHLDSVAASVRDAIQLGWALQQMVRQATYMARAGLAMATDFVTRGAATLLRTALGAQEDALLTAVSPLGTAIADETYQALRGVAAAVALDLTQRAEQLPRVVTHTLAGTLPSLVVAHKIYGDARRANEIVTANGIGNPAQIVGGQQIEVLSDA
ncbi:DNA circularization N-terminal domain-containing protein [Magnetococcus sp. PR-3]|uniref:DNA circularization N-terminal domain-containing protein n=1 Tax=Magnetococcus sp. PR-3 TaxID=3120355 RepID=UPI002FCE4AB9